MPGKAAAFEKPILGADGYLMAMRVNKYRLGLSVQEKEGLKSSLFQIPHHARRRGFTQIVLSTQVCESTRADHLSHEAAVSRPQ